LSSWSPEVRGDVPFKAMSFIGREPDDKCLQLGWLGRSKSLGRSVSLGRSEFLGRSKSDDGSLMPGQGWICSGLRTSPASWLDGLSQM
jgi:hypothetical protein